MQRITCYMLLADTGLEYVLPKTSRSDDIF